MEEDDAWNQVGFALMAVAVLCAAAFYFGVLIYKGLE